MLYEIVLQLKNFVNWRCGRRKNAKPQKSSEVGLEAATLPGKSNKPGSCLKVCIEIQSFGFICGINDCHY